MKMNLSLRSVGVLLLYLLLIVSASWVLPAVVRGEERAVAGQEAWWPSDKILLPELEAFSRVIDEKTKGIYLLPGTRFEQSMKLVEAEPRLVANAEGKLAMFEVVVSVTKQARGRYILRQYVYHGIWTRGIEEIFYDTSFVHRTREENKKLIDDWQAYQLSMANAVSSVNRETVYDAADALVAFVTVQAKGESLIDPAHLALDAFAKPVDHVFRMAFEPYVDTTETFDQFVKLFLIFDYDPSRKDRFFVEAAVLEPFSVGGGLLFLLYGENGFIADASLQSSPFELAKLSFRKFLELHNEWKHKRFPSH